MLNVTNVCDTPECIRNNCQTCERKSFQMNLTSCKYFLHRLQKQLDGAHF